MDDPAQKPHFDPSKIQRHVVVDVPEVKRVAADVPDTPQRRELERVRSIRQTVFGMQDGIITTLGVVTGVGQAAGDHWYVLLSGLIALIAGSLSMAVGEYLGSKSEQEVIAATVEMERREMEADPQAEYTEQVYYYTQKGFTAQEAEMIVSRLVQNPHVYLHEMTRDEFGIDLREAEGVDYRGVAAMALFFAIGSFLPILPYFFSLSEAWTIGLSLGLAVVGLFGVGYYAATLSHRTPWKKGLEIVLYGAIVFAVTFVAGRYVPPLFGHPPVSVGG